MTWKYWNERSNRRNKTKTRGIVYRQLVEFFCRIGYDARAAANKKDGIIIIYYDQQSNRQHETVSSIFDGSRRSSLSREYYAFYTS